VNACGKRGMTPMAPFESLVIAREGGRSSSHVTSILVQHAFQRWHGGYWMPAFAGTTPFDQICDRMLGGYWMPAFAGMTP
jgi:hypothetical protein